MSNKKDEVTLDNRTVVFDTARNLHVMQIKGVVVLPIGATIQLSNPIAEATVTGVTLLAGDPATVSLGVEVPSEWWDQQ